METESSVWDGRIVKTKKRFENVSFKVDQELFLRLKKIENKSKLIREAVREKLKNKNYI